MDARKVVLVRGASSGIGRATARLDCLEWPEHVAVTEITVRPATQEL